jgi:carboxylesterase
MSISKEKSSCNKETLEFQYPGNGNKILLIHGFSASPTSVKPLGKFLSEKESYAAHSVLLAGHGTKPEDLKQVTYLDWWHSVEKKFQEINGADFIIGHSMGGLLASWLGLKYHNSVKGIVLLSTPMWSSATFWKLMIKIGKYVRPYINKSAKSIEYAENNHLISYERIPLVAVDELNKLVDKTRVQVLPYLKKPPIMLVQGLKDDVIHPKSYKFLQKALIQESELILLKNSGHSVVLEADKEYLYEEIRLFIERNS